MHEKEVLSEIELVRTILIDVATSSRRITDTEEEYSSARSRVTAALATLGVADPNPFRSLWEWYDHWKAAGLATYRQRRAFATALYRPVQEELEHRLSRAPEEGAQNAEQLPFSHRQGYRRDLVSPAITIREDAPAELRTVVVDVATRAGLDYDDLLQVACHVGKRPWELPEPRLSGVSSRAQLRQLVSEWKWYFVYDFIETIHELLDVSDGPPHRCEQFAERLNEYFRHSGFGWQLANGRVEARGSEAFEAALHSALPALQLCGLTTARNELHEALADLSRRPARDLTGAIQHAMAALECVAREAADDPKGTLGELLKRHPNLLPKPLDAAVAKVWGYASEQGRHLREGADPGHGEAELVVGLSSVVVAYLAERLQSCTRDEE
ncbi:MAG: hypothetical protein IT349_08960 [Candidatus Eisenbacteria bacterium]|nr:hypothetical protein [Candidatus Eisenbacteria bacterium]